MIRYAAIKGQGVCADRVENYLPGNYSVIADMYDEDDRRVVVIEGTDKLGWNLDDYVLPRLSSGLLFGTEIGLDHPLMKRVPA